MGNPNKKEIVICTTQMTAELKKTLENGQITVGTANKIRIDEKMPYGEITIPIGMATYSKDEKGNIVNVQYRGAKQKNKEAVGADR